MKNESQIEKDRQLLTEMIYQKFGTFNLNKAQYGEVINRSSASISRDMQDGKGAAYKKDANGRVYFPLHSVVNYLLSTIHTVDSQEVDYE